MEELKVHKHMFVSDCCKAIPVISKGKTPKGETAQFWVCSKCKAACSIIKEENQ